MHSCYCDGMKVCLCVKQGVGVRRSWKGTQYSLYPWGNQETDSNAALSPACAVSTLAGPSFQPSIGWQTQVLTPWQQSSEQICGRCFMLSKGCTSSTGKVWGLWSISSAYRLQTCKVNGHLTQCHLHCPGCALMLLKTWHSHLYYKSVALPVCEKCVCV